MRQRARLDRPSERVNATGAGRGVRRTAMRNWMVSAAAVGMLLGGSPALAQKVIVDSNPAAAFASSK